jgi:dynein heavy chain
MSDPGILKKMKNVDKDNISDKKLRALEKYTQRGDMTLDNVKTKSVAAGIIWEWVIALEKYAKCFRDVLPKKIKVRELTDKLERGRKTLNDLQEKLKQTLAYIEELNQGLINAQEDKAQTEREAAKLTKQHDNANALVTGLSSSKIRWNNDVDEFNI